MYRPLDRPRLSGRNVCDDLGPSAPVENESISYLHALNDQARMYVVTHSVLDVSWHPALFDRCCQSAPVVSHKGSCRLRYISVIIHPLSLGWGRMGRDADFPDGTRSDDRVLPRAFFLT